LHFRPFKQENFLLMSQDGCLTMWHTDFSGTSVVYFLLKGCKTFHLVRPSDNNVALFRAYVDQARRDVFFGNHPDLNDGGCQKVVLVEGSAIIMPANMIHMVETHGTSVALGINFLHVEHLADAARHFQRERHDDEEFDKCFPNFPLLSLTYAAKLL
jgi:hypothetical protein